MSKPAKTGKSAKAKAPAAANTLLNPVLARREASYVYQRVQDYRAKVEARRGSYRATSNPRSRLSTVMGGSGDQHADPYSRRLARELSRDLIRNADTFRVLHAANCHAMIGEGVYPQPTTSDPEWNRVVGARMRVLYQQVAGGMDARQMCNVPQLQAAIWNALSADGDVAVLKLETMRVQLMEADQITGGGTTTPPGQIEGIDADDAGAPVLFHFCPYNALGIADMSAPIQALPQHVEFLALRDRHSQTRGMPELVAALDDWERIDSYRESEIVAAEQGANIYGAIENLPGDYGSGLPVVGSGLGDPVMANGVSTSGVQVEWQVTAKGAIMDLPNGKKYVPIDPKRPNPNCAPFLMEMLRQFTANIGLPYEWVYNDYRGLSWSINRALVQAARDRIRTKQAMLLAPAFSNLYLWKLEWAMAHDPIISKLAHPDDWQSHEHDWPVISWPDEGKEFEAQAHGLARALTTHQKVHGAAWQHIFQQRADALKLASTLARVHNGEFPEFRVDPYFFLGFGPTDAQNGTEDPERDSHGLTEAQRQQRHEAAQRAAENRSAGTAAADDDG